MGRDWHTEEVFVNDNHKSQAPGANGTIDHDSLVKPYLQSEEHGQFTQTIDANSEARAFCFFWISICILSASMYSVGLL